MTYYICSTPNKNIMINPYAYRTGLIAAGISIAYYLISYLIGIELFTSLWIPWVFIIGIIVYFIISLKKIREFMGHMTFAQGFVNFLTMSIVYIVLSNSFNYILINVIDPEFGIAVNDMVIEKVIGIMESMNTPEQAISEAITKMEEQIESQSSISGFLLNIATITFWYALIGLIVAAIMKSKNDTFTETVD